MLLRWTLNARLCPVSQTKDTHALGGNTEQANVRIHNKNKHFIFLKIKGSSREQFNLQRQPDLLVTKHFMLMISKNGDKRHYIKYIIWCGLYWPLWIIYDVVIMTIIRQRTCLFKGFNWSCRAAPLPWSRAVKKDCMEGELFSAINHFISIQYFYIVISLNHSKSGCMVGRVAKSDLNSTDAYFAKKLAPKNGTKMT